MGHPGKNARQRSYSLPGSQGWLCGLSLPDVTLCQELEANSPRSSNPSSGLPSSQAPAFSDKSGGLAGHEA